MVGRVLRVDRCRLRHRVKPRATFVLGDTCDANLMAPVFSPVRSALSAAGDSARPLDTSRIQSPKSPATSSTAAACQLLRSATPLRSRSGFWDRGSPRFEQRICPIDCATGDPRLCGGNCADVRQSSLPEYARYDVPELQRGRFSPCPVPAPLPKLRRGISRHPAGPGRPFSRGGG